MTIPGRSLAQGSAITLSSTAARVAVTVVAVPVSIRILGYRDFGVWNVCQTLVQLTPISFFGVNSAASYFTASAVGRSDARLLRLTVQRSLTLCGTCTVGYALLMIWFSEQILRAFLNDPLGGSSLMVATALAAAAFGLRAWFVSIEAGLQRYELASGLETATNLTAIVLSLAVAALGGSVASLMWTHFVVSAAAIGVHSVALWRATRRWRTGTVQLVSTVASEPPKLLRQGSAYFVSQFGGVLFGQIDRLLVSSFYGPTAAGVYTAVVGLGGRVNELSAAAAQVLMPRFAATSASGESATARQTFALSTAAVNAFILLLAGSLLAASGLVLAVLDLHGVEGARGLLLIAVPAYALHSTNAVGFFAMQGLGTPFWNALFAGVAGLLFAGSFWAALALGGTLMQAGIANYVFAVSTLVNYKVAGRVGYDKVRLLMQTGAFVAALGVIAGFVVVLQVLEAGSWLTLLVVQPVVLIFAVLLLGDQKVEFVRGLLPVARSVRSGLSMMGRVAR